MAIQKYKPEFEEGSLSKQSVPFTQLCNKTIQNCTNMEAIGMWAYLQSMPDDWRLNPVHLKTHFKIGKNKVYKILTYLIDAKLIVRHVQISVQGTRIKTTYTVLNGTEFVDPATVVEQCAPLPQYPEVDNPEVDNRDYTKERGLKKKEDIKETSSNISATDVAQENEACAFNTLWDIYPVKKNKIRAKKIWERKKLNKIAVLICNDVSNRHVNDSAWADEQYIPHPSTYLQNELWNDEITKASPNKCEHPITASIREFKKTHQSDEFKALLN